MTCLSTKLFEHVQLKCRVSRVILHEIIHESAVYLSGKQTIKQKTAADGQLRYLPMAASSNTARVQLGDMMCVFSSVCVSHCV